MRRAAAFFLLGLSSYLSACLEVPKIDPPPFVIDDFEGSDLMPRTKGFGPWSCEVVSPDSADGGAPGDPDAGTQPAIDGGSTISCARESNGDQGSCCALRMSFNLPPGMLGQDDDARISTSMDLHSAPMDFTRFQTFTFSSILETPVATPLPNGTHVFVELGCRSLQGSSSQSVSQSVPIEVGSGWTPYPLPLSKFTLAGASSNQACLVAVDSIRFVIRPGRFSEPAIGTLHIDNVYLFQ
jgi:hypothetical protein